jgi:hypothetical protein
MPMFCRYFGICRDIGAGPSSRRGRGALALRGDTRIFIATAKAYEYRPLCE